MKISDTYKRYLEVRGDIKVRISKLSTAANDERQQLDKIRDLFDKSDALAAELVAYLKPLADMARELDAESVSFERGRGVVISQNKYHTVNLSDICFEL